MHGTKNQLVAGTIAALLSLPGWSASLHVSPVSLRLAPGQGAVGLTLSNPSDKPLVAQVRLFAWSQDINDDHLTQQQELMVSPPIATLPAHSEQVVRIVRPGNAPPNKELTYRLLVDELPAPMSGDVQAAAVDIRIRYSIPLFVSPAGPISEPSVSWALVQRNDDWYLRASNAGGTHAQVSAVKVTLTDGKSINVADGLLGYALANSTRQWKLPAAPDRGAVPEVTATVNGRTITAHAEFASADAAH